MARAYTAELRGRDLEVEPAARLRMIAQRADALDLDAPAAAAMAAPLALLIHELTAATGEEQALRVALARLSGRVAPAATTNEIL